MWGSARGIGMGYPIWPVQSIKSIILRLLIMPMAALQANLKQSILGYRIFSSSADRFRTDDWLFQASIRLVFPLKAARCLASMEPRTPPVGGWLFRNNVPNKPTSPHPNQGIPRGLMSS
jgi:hypothetical protein